MSLLLFWPDCEYPRWTAGLFLPQNLFMLILFIDFYIKTYVRKPKSAVAKGITSNSHKDDDSVKTTNKNHSVVYSHNNVHKAQVNGKTKAN